MINTKFSEVKKWTLRLLFLVFLFQSCTTDDGKKKIVYINSYHQGHPSSDEIMQGFMDHIPADSFEVRAWYMDTKRNPSEEYIRKKALELLDSINSVNPDILVVSDDDAVKYIVAPNLKRLQMPMVFCGVNWTDREYHLPSSQVTGILEILPVADAVNKLKAFYPDALKVLVLNENTTTSRKEREILDTLFQRAGLSAGFTLVDNFDQWKTAFVAGNRDYDMIYISTHAAIKGWNPEEATAFVRENIQVPVFTCEDFMMSYAVFGVTKIAGEHGIWAAQTTKRILSGSAPADFPVTRNRESNIWINKRLSEIIGFKMDTTNLKRVRFVE